MSDNDPSLDDEVVRALRDVPPVDPRVREEHIAVALAEISASGSRSRSFGAGAGRWAVAAAAAVVVAGVGFAFGAASSAPDNGLVEGTDTSVTVDSLPAKGSAPGTDAVAPNGTEMLASECDDSVGLDPIARYRTDEGWRIAYIRDDSSAVLLIVDETSCTVLQEIDLP